MADEPMRIEMYRQMLRADNAEATLRDREHQLARMLELADAWKRSFGGQRIPTDLVVATLRHTITGREDTA